MSTKAPVIAKNGPKTKVKKSDVGKSESNATNKPRSAKPSAKKQADPSVEQLLEKIHRVQKRISESHLAAIEGRVEIGQLLNELKAKTPHGDWTEVREKTGYKVELTCQKLMKLAEEKFDLKIRDIGPDLKAHLPADLFKLDLLNRLSKDQLEDFMPKWEEEYAALSRGALSETIDAIVRPDEDPPKATCDNSSDSPSAESSSTTGESSNDDDTTEQNSDVEQTQTPKREVPTVTRQRIRRHVISLDKLDSKKPTKKMQALKGALEGNFPDFQKKIVDSAQRLGKKLASKGSCKAASVEQELIAVALVRRLVTTSTDVCDLFVPEKEEVESE